MGVFWIAAAFAAAYGLALALGGRLVVRQYSIRSDKITGSVRIAQLADLHGDRHGRDNRRLYSLIAMQAPDLVIFTGDNIRDTRPIDGIAGFVRSLASRWPVYWVNGNHERRRRLDGAQARMMAACGAVSLNDRCVLSRGLALCGVTDPYRSPASFEARLRAQKAACDALGGFQVLLSHRPEYAPVYARVGFDLALCGHAHGGQWRIPGLLNGLFAPNQGLFPKYAGGLYPFGKGTVIVSRGLLKRFFVPRLFNPTELVIVDLLPAQGEQGATP